MGIGYLWIPSKKNNKKMSIQAGINGYILMTRNQSTAKESPFFLRNSKIQNFADFL